MARKGRVTLEQWINEALSDSDKGGACSALSLVHVRTGGTDEIHGKALNGAPQDARALAQFFTQRATTYSQDLVGMQTFKLLAFYNGSEQAQAVFPFVTNDGEVVTASEAGFAKNEANVAGMLGQLMRHNESIMAMSHDLVKTYAMESMRREARMQQEINEAQHVMRDVMLNMTQETHKAKLAELEFQRTTDERKMIAQVAPMVLNQLSGREIVPVNHADSQLLDALSQSVRPEQLEQLGQLGLIPPALVPVLAGRFAQAAARRASERQALATLPPEEPLVVEDGAVRAAE